MKKNNKKGFTLVELVIVVAVMAVLVAVAIPTVKSITQSAKDATYNTNCRTIESMLKLAEADAVKDGNTPENFTLSTTQIKTALDEARLGITSGSYAYTPSSGIVDNTGANGDLQLTFGSDGTVTVSNITSDVTFS